MKDKIHICLEPEDQDPSKTFKVLSFNLKTPHFASYMAKKTSVCAKIELMFASKLSQAKKKADSAVTDVILFWLMMGHNIPWDFDTTLLFILMGIRLDNNTHHI